MRLSPELHTVLFQQDEFTFSRGDDVHVRREGVGELLVDALRHVRVVVAGQDHDRSSDRLHELAGHFDVGTFDTHVVEEVAGDGDDIDIGFHAQFEHMPEGLQRRF